MTIVLFLKKSCFSMQVNLSSPPWPLEVAVTTAFGTLEEVPCVVVMLLMQKRVNLGMTYESCPM